MDPPCDSCKKPGDLNYKNNLAYSIWERCDKHREVSIGGMGGLMPQKLKISEIISTCNAFRGRTEDLEKVLIIEDVAYQFVMKRYKKE